MTGVQTCALPISPAAGSAAAVVLAAVELELRGLADTDDLEVEGQGEIGRASCRERV